MFREISRFRRDFRAARADDVRDPQVRRLEEAVMGQALWDKELARAAYAKQTIRNKVLGARP